jgi:transcriptional regulator with XRE-family HTH domain
LPVRPDGRPGGPFCSFTLTAQKPPKIPQNPKTLGDHIKKRRLEQGLYQADVARILGVTECTITNWEKNRSNPTLRPISKIIEFLGYAPKVEIAQTLGRRIVQCRKLRGINQETMARQLGVDPTTLGKWERDESQPEGKLLNRVESFMRSLRTCFTP